MLGVNCVKFLLVLYLNKNNCDRYSLSIHDLKAKDVYFWLTINSQHDFPVTSACFWYNMPHMGFQVVKWAWMLTGNTLGMTNAIDIQVTVF